MIICAIAIKNGKMGLSTNPVIFDSSDFAYENRYFNDYFFSEQPFTKDVIFKLALLPYKGNCELDINELPESFPHIYYVGEGENMKVTI